MKSAFQGAVLIRKVSLPCDPVVENVRFDGETDIKTSKRLKTLFEEDQRNASEPVDWTDPERVLQELGAEFIEQADDQARHRRIEVLKLLQEGKITLPEDLYHAAMIYQHGTCSDHFKLANELAERSMNLGYRPAYWLYAASRDRYLLAIGHKNSGHNFIGINSDNGTCHLWISTQTDEERAKYDVPPITELWQRLRNFSKGEENMRTKWQQLVYKCQSWLINKTAH